VCPQERLLSQEEKNGRAVGALFQFCGKLARGAKPKIDNNQGKITVATTNNPAVETRLMTNRVKAQKGKRSTTSNQSLPK